MKRRTERNKEIVNNNINNKHIASKQHRYQITGIRYQENALKKKYPGPNQIWLKNKGARKVINISETTLFYFITFWNIFDCLNAFNYHSDLKLFRQALLRMFDESIVCNMYCN